ncbi:MAG: hypothetical protein LBJ94_01355 [Puniceicoccales bacterium]|jgi:hypothetical protein|nr:hypothetical protein [Puniceicoccales bacterium]
MNSLQNEQSQDMAVNFPKPQFLAMGDNPPVDHLDGIMLQARLSNGQNAAVSLRALLRSCTEKIVDKMLEEREVSQVVEEAKSGNRPLANMAADAKEQLLNSAPIIGRANSVDPVDLYKVFLAMPDVAGKVTEGMYS